MECLLKIKDDDIRGYIEEVIKDRDAEANDLSRKVFEATYYLLLNDKSINPYASVTYTDIILAGAFLHNIAANRAEVEEDVCNLFKHRKILEGYFADNAFIRESVVPQICLIIESQLGKNTPIQQLVPTYGSLGFFPALACSLVYGGKWNDSKED